MSERPTSERLAQIKDEFTSGGITRMSVRRVRQLLAEIDHLTAERDAAINDLRISNDSGHTWANYAAERLARIIELEGLLRESSISSFDPTGAKTGVEIRSLRARIAELEAALRRVTQEPSQAAIEAAISASWHARSAMTPDDMRHSLRAAYAVDRATPGEVPR